MTSLRAFNRVLQDIGGQRYDAHDRFVAGFLADCDAHGTNDGVDLRAMQDTMDAEFAKAKRDAVFGLLCADLTDNGNRLDAARRRMLGDVK